MIDTMRDQLALAAMQALLQNPTAKMELPKNNHNLAEICYELADAMLKAREVRSE